MGENYITCQAEKGSINISEDVLLSMVRAVINEIDGVASILSSDNPVRLRRQVAQAFGLAELFAYVGITEQNGLLTMDLSGPEGEREQLTLSALPIDDRCQ